jgi:hypothetical protein
MDPAVEEESSETPRTSPKGSGVLALVAVLSGRWRSAVGLGCAYVSG